MDSIWLCVTTILLHLLINRLFGRLDGWPRLVQWPAMQLSAMTAHFFLVSAPMLWLLQWTMPLTGVSAQRGDLVASILAALAAALLVRCRLRARRVAP